MEWNRIVLVLFHLFVASEACASKAEGTFSAVKTCPAYQSFIKGHNPGDIHVIPGRQYEVVEENKPDGPWALIIVPESDDARRWVSKECGLVSITSQAPASPVLADTRANQNCTTANSYDSNVLALSWQAGFCEHYAYSGSKPECDNLNAGRISITNITIHGLWPNKASCGTRYGSCPGAPLNLEEETVSKLAPWMPNWYYSTEFGNHEWTKHGTCQSLADDDYFLLIQRLAKKFDDSALGAYLRKNMGKTVRVSEMENALSLSLGKEVVGKIKLICPDNGKKYLNEIWINLPRDINEQGGLAELVAGAKSQSNFAGSCADEIYVEVPGPN